MLARCWQRRADDHRRDRPTVHARPRPGAAGQAACRPGRDADRRQRADPFLDDTPTAVMVRQILGSVSEFEKTTLVAKLKAARDRKKAVTGKCGGRKSHLEERPDVVALAKSLRRKRPRGAPMSLREISAALAAEGYLNEAGKPVQPEVESARC